MVSSKRSPLPTSKRMTHDEIDKARKLVREHLSDLWDAIKDEMSSSHHDDASDKQIDLFEDIVNAEVTMIIALKGD